MTDESRESTLTAPPVSLCGDPNDPKERDTEFLWRMAWDCLERPIDSFWLVSKGAKGYLLVATDRIKGIECPDLVSGAFAGNNYWQAAQDRANYWFRNPQWGTVGLGINAAGNRAAGTPYRSHDQLHIHLSNVRPGVKDELDRAYNAGKIPKNLQSWPTGLTTVTGQDAHGMPQPRSYRVVHVDSFKSLNLFKALYDNVVVATRGEEMGDQTMIVINAGSAPNGGFYILNSREYLPHPSGAPDGLPVCDSVLACK